MTMQQDARKALIERLRQFRVPVEVAGLRMAWDTDWPLDKLMCAAADALEALSASSGSSAPGNVDLAWLIDRLETYYDFTSTGGGLTNCVEWQALKALMASGSPRADQLKQAFEAGMGWTLSWDRPFKQADADRGFALFLRRPNVVQSSSSGSEEKPPNGPMLFGSWPKDCIQRAFVDGASWWQFKSNGATAFPSERDEMEIQALRRYGAPATSRFPYAIRGTNGSPDVVCRSVDDVIRQAEHLGAVCEAHWSELVRLREELAETNEALAACQSQAGGRERAAFEAGCHARPCGDDGWTFEAPSDSQARAAAEAYAAYEAQSSPSQSEETPQSLVNCDDCLRDVPFTDRNSRCPECAAEWLKRDCEIRGLSVETPEERKNPPHALAGECQLCGAPLPHPIHRTGEEE